MRVLVTGGGGYLGCWVTQILLDRGHSVRVFDRFVFGRGPIATFEEHPQCEVIAGDIRRQQEFPALLDGMEGVVHLAALSNDPSCDLNPEMTIDVNVESTRELAQRAVQHGVRRFVLASSCSVYGSGMFDVLDEESPANPVSAYGESKWEGEQIVLPMKSSRFEPVAGRPATLFGWSPRMRFDLAVNQMTATAGRNGVINVMGGGNQWRPFVHVRDCARAFADMLDAPAEAISGEAFNVGCSNNNVTIIDLAKRVAAHFEGIELNVAPDDADRRSYNVVFDKIHDRLGFTCEVSIDDGVREIKEKLRDEALDPFSDLHFNVRRMKALIQTPVDEGGEPLVPRFIALSKPNLGEEELEAVRKALESGWITSGPHIKAFESAFSETVAAEHAVAVTSCTAALHLCLVHHGVRAGDEVITSPLTWASTGNTVLHMGAKVVFADIDPATLNMDPASVEAAITDKTKVIMPVHLAGQPCDMEAIRAIGAKHGIPVVEDAAHALGAAYKGQTVGSADNFACFSFYAIKNITTMEGGAITTPDPEAAAHLRMLAANGMTAAAWDRYGRSAAPAPAEVQEPGFKYLMSNVSAAMGVEQLKKFPQFRKARRRLAGLYQRALGEIDEISLPHVADPEGHAWHLMIVRLDTDRLGTSRDAIAEALRRENVGTGCHFYGLHLHRYYREKLGFQPEMLPHATKASKEIISLPLHPGLSDKNVHDVIEAVKKVLTHAGR